MSAYSRSSGVQRAFSAFVAPPRYMKGSFVISHSEVIDALKRNWPMPRPSSGVRRTPAMGTRPSRKQRWNISCSSTFSFSAFDDSVTDLLLCSRGGEWSPKTALQYPGELSRTRPSSTWKRESNPENHPNCGLRGTRSVQEIRRLAVQQFSSPATDCRISPSRDTLRIAPAHSALLLCVLRPATLFAAGALPCCGADITAAADPARAALPPRRGT